jgi:two-component sensor histidine kinase/CheY-like chemotaxis protein
MEEKHIRVLMIEDNLGDVRLIQEMLTKAKGVKFELGCTNNLSTGLNQIDTESIDVILLDLSLPDSQGLDTFIEVYAHAQSLPIIVLSGLDDEDIAVKAVQKGAQDYLVKGQVDSNLLVRSIRYAIERKQSEDQIRAALKEKDVLIKEIHHRVKNNLQIISSLLKLQCQHIKDEEILGMFNDSRNRVKTMALIHEKLYRSKDLASIDFKGYTKDLLGDLYRSYGPNTRNIALKKDIEDVSLEVEAAIPCGLIINELVSNALKHAFPDNREGEINIKLCSSDGGKIELTVNDNGIGIPKDIDIKNMESLGLRLVSILVEDQLKGKIKIDRSKGTKFQIEFRVG